MKRIGLVAVLLIVALMFASCKGNADPTPDTTGESGGNTSADVWNYPFSGHATDFDTVGWYSKNSGGTTHTVGSKGQDSANALGIYDMSGNVWEWCYDWRDSISTGNETNPTGPSSSPVSGRCVGRGGSWDNTLSYSVCFRNNPKPDEGEFNLGFRVVRSVVE